MLEIDHHESIVSHEIFDAVQAKLQCERYARERHPLPTLDVIDGGVLKGYVSVNRTWCGFTGEDYKSASESVYTTDNNDSACADTQSDSGYSPDSDADRCFLDGYEIVRSQFFSIKEKPVLTIGDRKLTFNTICLKKFENVEYVEMLINTVNHCVAIRPCTADNPNAIHWGRQKDGRWIPAQRTISGFAAALCSIAGWEQENKYRLCGQFFGDDTDKMFVFDLSEPEIIRTVDKGEYEESAVQNGDNLEENAANVMNEETPSEKVIVLSVERSYPKAWNGRFGRYDNETAFERVPYKGNWEILRPAKLFSTAGGVKPEIIEEISAESKKMLLELGCAI